MMPSSNQERTMMEATTNMTASNITASNDPWYPSEIAEFMVLRENMEAFTYEIEAEFKAELIGKQVKVNGGNFSKLRRITGFEIDSEEFCPAHHSDRALNARMRFHVDAECEKNGIKSEVSKLPVCFDFEYYSHNTGYTISAMSINC